MTSALNFFSASNAFLKSKKTFQYFCYSVQIDFLYKIFHENYMYLLGNQVSIADRRWLYNDFVLETAGSIRHDNAITFTDHTTLHLNQTSLLVQYEAGGNYY